MDELIKRLRRAAKESFFLKDLLTEAADALQDVQPVKHGKWMYCSIEDMFHCTRCDAAAVRNSFVYCPICGARMDGET